MSSYPEPDRNLSVRERNKLYREAKKMREEIRESLCKKDEMMYPTPENVRKFLNTEWRLQQKIRRYKDYMKAQGAEFKEYDVERLRRGKIRR